MFPVMSKEQENIANIKSTMKKSIKLLAAALAAITAMSCVNVTAFAEQKTVYGEEYVQCL